MASEFRNAIKRLQNSFKKLRKKTITVLQGQDEEFGPSKSLTFNTTDVALNPLRPSPQEYNNFSHSEIFPPEVARGKCEDCSRISVLKQEKIVAETLAIKNFVPFHPHVADRKSLHVSCKTTYEAFPNTYKNNSVPRGLVFMLNFEEFEEKVLTREGSQIDYKNLLDLFQKMGYKCDEESGFCKSGKITREECFQRFLAFINFQLHERLDSCIVVLMSHGAGEKAFLSSDGGVIKVKEIYRHINGNNCPHLKGKPKIFIFQFCRISESDTEEVGISHSSKRFFCLTSRNRTECLSNSSALGSCTSLHKRNSRVLSVISISSSAFNDSGCEDELGSNFNCSPRLWNESGTSTSFPFPPLPILSIDGSRVNMAFNEIARPNSDMFSIFSTVEGEVSYRDPKKGSLLIQSICHVFAENACNDDIEELFKKVSRHMTTIFQNDQTNSLSISQQQTCERTNIAFDQDFYFNPQPLLEKIEKSHPIFH